MRSVFVLAAALLAAPLAAQDFGGRRCATPAPTVTEALETARLVESLRFRADLLAADPEPITVPVAVHVIRSGASVAQGDVPDGWIEAQIDTLNAGFAPLGVRFALALVQRVDNAEWYEDLRLGSAAERDMKEALALDPARVLNLYTASLGLDYLGWATLPDARAEVDDYQGVVVLDQSLPGGNAVPYHLGHTGTHEVGHWAGLSHTFAGGCSAPGDGVADTPQQRTGTSGCPSPAPDTCPADPGDDPIHNFMDYSDDACMTGFTGGQGERVRALLTARRPTVVAGGYATALVPRGALAELFVGVETVVPLRVVNASAAPLSVGGATADGAAVTLDATVVPPGESAVIDLRVRPTRSGAISVAVVTDGALAVVQGLSGVAALPPTASLRQASVGAELIEDAETVTTLTLANDGDGPLAYDVDEGSLPPWVARVAPASGRIGPHSEVVFAVTFSSEGLDPGTRTGTVRVDTNDPVNGDVAFGVALDVRLRPLALAAGPVFPNPGRGLVTVPLELPTDAAVTADVVDVQGRVVAVLADGRALPAGYPTLRWDASRAAPGLYVVRVRTEAEAAVARAVILR